MEPLYAFNFKRATDKHNQYLIFVEVDRAAPGEELDVKVDAIQATVDLMKGKRTTQNSMKHQLLKIGGEMDKFQKYLRRINRQVPEIKE